MDGVPVTPEATQKLIERIAFIRHTHYGMDERPALCPFLSQLTFLQADFGISQRI